MADSASGPIYWKGISPEDVSWASRELPRALALAASRLRREPTRPLTTVLLPNRFEMRRFLDREQIATSSSPYWQPLGVTVPSLGLVVIRWDHQPPTESLTETLLHEAVHVVLHTQSPSRLPRWLDEGLAQWVSGRRLSPDEVSYLALLARVGGLYPFESLQARFPPTHELSSIAYQESFFFVQYFVSLKGESQIPALIDAASENPIDVAIRGLLGKDMARAEAEFHAWVLGQATWAAALASIVNLWTLSGLLALAAVLRHWLRRRRRLKVMAAAEVASDASEPGVGSEETLGPEGNDEPGG